MALVKKILPLARERLVTITDDAPLTEAAKSIDGSHHNLVIICNKSGVMVGIVTRTDVVRQMSLCQGCGCNAIVGTVMTKDVICCHPDELLQDVWSLMREKGFLHVPIVDDDFRPLGVINERDALLILFEEKGYDEALLRDYVMGVGYR
ncbi:Signal-transduction protein [Candidatus Nitrotoga arctica]|uniref:Signal-transduction protein n=2 Tax=Candidatus Nitrotoga arctica TaxID=453162 RepID=A0ABN8ALV1_9PROT|nr:Signal-transduction protein [Candidatus Nitrotoga arctica]